MKMSAAASLAKGSRPRSTMGGNKLPSKTYSASSIKNHKYEFSFDKIFIPGQSTLDVYKESVQPILMKAIKQKTNFTLFLYGQTGGGKTYTMIGDRQSCSSGVLHLSLQDILARNKVSPTSGGKVSVSYMQIYNERISDLLHPSEMLSSDQEVHLPSMKTLTIVTIENIQQALVLLEIGESKGRRAYAQTKGNFKSSRSHVIFRVNVVDAFGIKSEYNFVDLAGSESLGQADELHNKELL